jgi:ribosome-associated toxin RatA of RatAB toxin-antitoxin module
MVSINESIIMSATAERIWDVVSDVDRDSEYWSGLSSIRNIRKEANLIEREVTVGFMGQKGLQRIEFKPKESVQLTMTKGPLKGSRLTRLTPADGGGRTKVEISWDFEFSGVPSFARPFVRSQLERGTKEALTRIAKEVEPKPVPGHSDRRRGKRQS